MKDSPKRVLGNIRGVTEVDPWTMLSLSTMFLALSIGLGPQLGVVPIAIFSMFWLITAVWLSVVLVRLGRSEYRWLFGIGVGLATLRMTSLGLIQVIQNRPALFWNVDWRYHATHAQGIARFGGAADTLDFAGAPLQYHAGPSWIAGALQNVVGIPVNVVLFILVPAVCVPLVAVNAVRILRVLKVQGKVALVTVSICMNLPNEVPKNFATFVKDPRPARAVDLILDPGTWMFSPHLMLNSLLALCVGLVAVSTILAARRASTLIIGGACLGSLIFLKPQHLVGFAAVFVLALIFSASKQVATRPRFALGILLLTSALVAGFAIYRLGGAFNEVQFDFSILMRPRAFLPEILMWLILMGLLLFFSRQLISWEFKKFTVGALIGYVALVFAVRITTFLLDPKFVANAKSVGLSIERKDFDLVWEQAFLPSNLVLLLLAFSMLISRLQVLDGRSKIAIGFSGIAFALVLPLTIGPLVQPTGSLAYEWAEEQDLVELIRSVDFGEGTWLSSDFNDPAENFVRPGLGYHLTSSSSAQFYISGWYGTIRHPDFPSRVRNSQKFFGTEWSPWHEKFLKQKKIVFVLVRDRCPVVWSADDFLGSVFGVQGDWLILKVGGTPSLIQGTNRWFNASNVNAVYGLSECRLFEQTKN